MGCVNVVDCLSQEEYIAQYPQGENESPFMFICKDPIMMTNHFPIKGQHKICEFFFLIYCLIYWHNYVIFFSVKLDEKILNAAQKCLMKEISWLWY